MANDYAEPSSKLEHYSKKFAVLNELREAEELCDVTLIVGGKRLKGHRNVLASGSPYFRKMFTSSMLETNLEEIPLPEISYETMEQVVQFLYISRIRLTTETAQNILIAANFLEMLDLVESCGTFVVRQIDATNCFSLRNLLKTTNCDEKIMAKANGYINNNVAQITENESFLQLDINDVVEFLSDTELCCKSEEDVAHAAIRWLNASSERKRYAQQIFNCIRLSLLSDTFKSEYIDSNPLFHEDTINRNITVSGIPRGIKTSLLSLNTAGERSLQKYNSSTKSWTKFVDIERKRYDNITSNSDYLVLSGESNDNLFFDLLNLKTKQWKSFQLYVSRLVLLQLILLDAKLLENSFTSVKVRKFDTEAKRWEDVTLMEQQKEITVATAYNGKIYFFEKFVIGLAYPHNFYVYDPATNEKKALAPVKNSEAFKLVTTSDGIYVLRGISTWGQRVESHDIDFYDVENDEWQYEVKFPGGWETAMLTTIPDMYRSQ